MVEKQNGDWYTLRDRGQIVWNLLAIYIYAFCPSAPYYRKIIFEHFLSIHLFVSVLLVHIEKLLDGLEHIHS